MELLFIGLIAGTILAYLIFARFQWVGKKKRTATQAVVLKDKIKQVCKLISVEGDFAEIYHYESVKEKFFDVLLGKKKALILIDAKAHVGFNLSKINIESDSKTKTLKLTHFPQPELLTIETDFKYYDKKEGWLNPFTSNDLTEINKEAKQYIIDKIPQSGLINEARKEALKTILLAESLAASIGWKIDYTALELANIEEPDKKQILID
ncbi:DUF4230 domain-containing protein [Aquimarina agarilytica]|uniref:DUF4230 domain-containing protein n=1 Tax=Aquimarina agarilytica TaxID=1087449 RepID=UPI0002899CC6|nr:DUF4230 domain-containing protein [Aquimarina agarilytica]